MISINYEKILSSGLLDFGIRIRDYGAVFLSVWLFLLFEAQSPNLRFCHFSVSPLPSPTNVSTTHRTAVPPHLMPCFLSFIPDYLMRTKT